MGRGGVGRGGGGEGGGGSGARAVPASYYILGVYFLTDVCN